MEEHDVGTWVEKKEKMKFQGGDIRELFEARLKVQPTTEYRPGFRTLCEESRR